ncbi:hypothetical protein MICRO80W_10032 [Micrococcus luteus]|nr:hypothetical protein MICRO80W_10032 [Micrococcus luteus]
MQVAPITYDAAKDRAPSARAVSDAALTPQLVTPWQDNYCVYGVRKLWKIARRAGIDIGRDQTGRLMRAAGIEGATRSKRVKTTRPDPTAARHPGPGEAGVHCDRAESALGHRSDARADLGGRRFRLLHR